MSDYIELGSVAEFVSDRIDIERVNKQNYISTENMIENKGGVINAKSLPTSKTVLNYKPEDILVSNIRLYFEKIWFADKEGGSSADVLVLRTAKGYIPKFIYYVLSDSNFFKYADVTSKGTKMPRGDKKAILKYIIPDYPIYYQKKITTILSTYDNLIENNNRRIQILEQTAEELYKEWFVRMRFPGYEKTKFDKGIPEGWGIKKVDEIISFDIGGGWGEESLMNDFTEQAYVIRGTDIPNMKYGEFNYELLRYHKKSNLKSRKLESTDIIFEASGGSKDQRLGRTFYVTEEILSMYDNDVICASFCKLIKIEDKYLSWFFYNYLRYAYQTEILSTFEVQSTGISNFGFSKFKKHHQLLVPTSNVMEQFYKLTYPMLLEMQKLGNKNQNLKKQRDLLLPRLMNGTITVK